MLISVELDPVMWLANTSRGRLLPRGSMQTICYSVICDDARGYLWNSYRFSSSLFDYVDHLVNDTEFHG